MKAPLSFTTVGLSVLCALSACTTASNTTRNAGPVAMGGGVSPGKDAPKELAVKFEPMSGSNVTGTLSLKQREPGVQIMGTLTGLPPKGKFGFHVHQFGDCSAPDALSAGEHFNPDKKNHGPLRLQLNVDAHAGDLGNIESDEHGNARINITAPVLSLDPKSIYGITGRSLIVHAKPDDMKTQPSGESDGRIACAVIPPAPPKK